MTGVVKWFGGRHTSFGFIDAEDGGPDVFVHYSAVEGQEGRRTLQAGARVSFDLEETPKGRAARNVWVLTE